MMFGDEFRFGAAMVDDEFFDFYLSGEAFYVRCLHGERHKRASRPYFS